MQKLVLGSLILLSAVASVSATSADPVAKYMQQKLQVSSFKRADVDLNSDGRAEALIYATDRDNCGSGGCDLYVLSPEGRSYRVVMDSSVTQLPIWLLPTSSHGWRDIGVTVSGGGTAQPYMARMRFNGHHYPDNPTVPPAVPLKRPSGKLVISR